MLAVPTQRVKNKWTWCGSATTGYLLQMGLWELLSEPDYQKRHLSVYRLYIGRFNNLDLQNRMPSHSRFQGQWWMNFSLATESGFVSFWLITLQNKNVHWCIILWLCFPKAIYYFLNAFSEIGVWTIIANIMLLTLVFARKRIPPGCLQVESFCATDGIFLIWKSSFWKLGPLFNVHKYVISTISVLRPKVAELKTITSSLRWGSCHIIHSGLIWTLNFKRT